MKLCAVTSFFHKVGGAGILKVSLAVEGGEGSSAGEGVPCLSARPPTPKGLSSRQATGVPEMLPASDLPRSGAMGTVSFAFNLFSFPPDQYKGRVTSEANQFLSEVEETLLQTSGPYTLLRQGFKGKGTFQSATGTLSLELWFTLLVLLRCSESSVKIAVQVLVS